ncbi:hypothetical protein [Pseudomonas sp. TNT2022 ID642]|uniref:hypothetical protein n=1 Tax=Pseudomonas sp. TNT2022 ID642 TaxID=2942632 RepID=UPI002362D0E9|nr:hypothetical protein [Pseudomonas sp. TNT2022 ID642]MDD1002097.1 hypothetical protein [Pseudomonas sp. TNT2022 ID642]
MKKEKFGIRVRDQDGSLLLEVGPHIMQDSPKFAEKIGLIAALWAQTEVSLYCLFAVLLNTTLVESRTRLKKYNNAAKTASAMRKLATEHLNQHEVDSILEILDCFDTSRLKRNRVQHDVWAKKGGITHTLFTIHATDYFEFSTKYVELSESTTPDEERFKLIITLANEFAKNTSTGYTVSDLSLIEQELEQLNASLMKATFYRLKERSATLKN